jgi:hypothetical protein
MRMVYPWILMTHLARTSIWWTQPTFSGRDTAYISRSFAGNFFPWLWQMVLKQDPFYIFKHHAYVELYKVWSS